MAASNGNYPVVVGIDGSAAALDAALWAIDEAEARDVPLRLVSSIDRDGSDVSGDELRMSQEYAQTSLRSARTAIDATGRSVKVESAVLEGSPGANLIEESRHAAMICVGSSGIGRFAASLFGSTATSVAEHAHCPVAIIRRHPSRQSSGPGMIAVPVGAFDGDDHVIATAVAEAALRGRSVLAVGVWERDFGNTPYDELDRRTARWQERHPHVRIHVTAGAAGISQFLAEHTEPVDMVVLPSDDADEVANIVGPHSRSLTSHPECSVLIVRQ